jgi:hypothetical protein
MADNGSILVTGAAGQLEAVGRTVTGLLLERGLPVRAMVRREDDRAAALRAAGAEVVVGDLLEPADGYRVVRGCRRVYFGMSVSAAYLEATVTMAAVFPSLPVVTPALGCLRYRFAVLPPQARDLQPVLSDNLLVPLHNLLSRLHNLLVRSASPAAPHAPRRPPWLAQPEARFAPVPAN